MLVAGPVQSKCITSVHPFHSTPSYVDVYYNAGDDDVYVRWKRNKFQIYIIHAKYIYHDQFRIESARVAVVAVVAKRAENESRREVPTLALHTRRQYLNHSFPHLNLLLLGLFVFQIHIL